MIFCTFLVSSFLLSIILLVFSHSFIMDSVPILSGTNKNHKAIIMTADLNADSDKFQSSNTSPDNGSNANFNSDPLEEQGDTAKDDNLEWVDDDNEEEEDRISLGLVGKLWSDRTLNPMAFITTIKNVWVTNHGVDINMIGKNSFQFQFYHWRDKEKVLAGQP